MTEPDWAKILQVMHEKKKIRESVTSDDETQQIQYLSNTIEDLTEMQVRRTLQYMNTIGLVEPVGKNVEDRGPFILSSKGFSVAHDRRMQKHQEQREDQRNKRQHDVNRAIAFLTLGLLVVTVGDSATRVFVGMNSFIAAQWAVITGLASVLAFVVLLNYFGLLSPPSTE